MTKVLKKTVLARKAQIKELHKLYSWRRMSEDIYGGRVSFQVLARFVTDKDYIPADADILRELELITPVNPYRVLPRWYNRTPASLEYWNSKKAQIKKMSDEARRQRNRV